MSNSPKIIPAFELVKAHCRIDEAKMLYDSMSNAERETTDFVNDFIERRLNARKSNYVLEEQSSTSLEVRCQIITEKIKNYFLYLGYNVTLLPNRSFSQLESPVLIISWC